LFDPSFSPDGTQIVYSAGNETKANLFIMKIDDGSSNQITFMNSSNRSPTWSPDGKSIAFVSGQEDKNKIWLVKTDGEGLSELSRTHPNKNSGAAVIWSSDRKLLYLSQGNRNYSVFDLNTETEHKLIQEDSVGWLSKARISRDKTKLVVFWNQNTIRGLFIISLIDHSQNLLKEGEWEPIGWSNDGNYVYALNEKSQILRISAADEKITQLPELPFKRSQVPYDIVETDVSDDGRQFIFNVPEERSDVWIVSYFDPDVHFE
jgi:WD40 repeat protein